MTTQLPTMHVVSSDDWKLVYRDGDLVYEGHGGTYWADAIALVGMTVRSTYLEGDEELVADTMTEAALTLDEFLRQCHAAGFELVWSEHEPRRRS